MAGPGATVSQPLPPAAAVNGIRAAIVQTPGSEPLIGSIALRPRAAGTTLLAVLAAPLNPLDLLIASGTFHSSRHEAPYVPGSECVGIVLDSESQPAGTWVYAQCHPSPRNPGAFATQTLVLDEELVPLPVGLDPVRAAAVGNSGTAAFMPLIQNARLQPGETVLVLGATGAVGQLAVQIAHQRGAGRVTGVARNRDALQKLLELGADAVVDLRTDESETELARRLDEATGPVDVILDGLYGKPLQAALRVCATGARVVNIGNLAGPTAQIPAGQLRAKQISLSGFAGLHTPLRDKQPALAWLWAGVSSGQIQVDLRTVALDELPSAWRRQAVSPHTKIVVLPGDLPTTNNNSTIVEF